MASLADGIFSESTVNFVGKDGFVWWVGEVEDNEDPMELGRVKVRCLGYYTNFAGGTLADLPTGSLPWATVLQHTSQAGNDGQGESAGQLQPGAIVLGFFMDGEDAQMPIVLGVMRVNKSSNTRRTKEFALTNHKPRAGEVINTSALYPSEHNAVNPEVTQRQSTNNAVAYPGLLNSDTGGYGSPKNIGVTIPGGYTNPIKPLDPEKPIPAANGVAGAWKTLDYKLSYLVEDISLSCINLVKCEAGDYLDLPTGQLITKDDIYAPLKSFMTVVYAQVISSVRGGLVALAEDLKITNLMLKNDGTPFKIYNTVVSATTQILNTACAFDANLDKYVSETLTSVEGQIDAYLAGVIDQKEFLTFTVEEISGNIIQDVNAMMKDIGDLSDAVKKKVEGISDDADILLNEWEKGLKIFSDKTELFQKGQYEYVSINAVFKLLGSFGAPCTRSRDHSQKAAGWYPLFGLTKCPLDELEDLNKIRGNNKDLEKNPDLLSTIYTDADPYLTTAKNHINGSYDLWLGTPGRQADVSKRVNGTTHTSICLNNSHFAEKVARDEYKKNNPKASETEIEAAVDAYRRKQTGGKGDTGSLVADHISYAGNLTQEVHGDDCKLVSGHHAVSIDGDYFLKITGDCHIEVGGGFFFTAEGAPKSGAKMQKHALKFGSDVDMNVVGAKMHFESSELDLSATKTRVTGRYYENTSDSQTFSALEITLQSQSSIQVVTPHLLELIGVEDGGTTKKHRGKRSVTVGGNYIHHYATTQQNLYQKYLINLNNERAAYNDDMQDGELREFVGDSIKRLEKAT